MIGNFFIPGAGVNYDVSNGIIPHLEAESRTRAEIGADLFHGNMLLPHGKIFSEEGLLIFSGAYPRLPKGVIEVSTEKREAALMRDIAVVERAVPSERTAIESDATSTIDNVLNTLRSMTGSRNPDARDIQKVINPSYQLGIVASRAQMPRIANILQKMGCSRASLVEVITEPSQSLSGLVNYVIQKTGVSLVKDGDADGLQKLSGRLEAVNDARHNLIDGAKKLLGRA